LRSIDCACYSLSIPNLTPFDLAQWIQLPGCQVNPPHFKCPSTPNLIVDAQPHSCRPNPTSDCAQCMSTPNSMPCDLVSFMKPNGCRLHVSTSTTSGPSHMDRANILAELNALQERYSTLALALTDSSLATPHHQDGYALLSPRPIDVGVAVSVNPSDGGLSPGTEPIVTSPEGWGASAASDLAANFMDQTSQTPFGYAARTTGVLRSEASVLNQETPSRDHPQLHTFLDNNIDSELQDIFDFNAASLPLGFDVHDGVSTYVAERATEDESNITPTLPSISQSDSDPTVVAPAVSRTETRHRCQSCMKTFRRSGDRDRHALSHNPSAPRYACSFPGCNRVGRRGFLRRDKLTQHQVHMRH
jgi:hypothetical protein